MRVFLAMADDGRVISAHRTYAGARQTIQDEIRDVCTPNFSETEIQRCFYELDRGGWVDGIGGIEDAGELGD